MIVNACRFFCFVLFIFCTSIGQAQHFDISKNIQRISSTTNDANQVVILSAKGKLVNLLDTPIRKAFDKQGIQDTCVSFTLNKPAPILFILTLDALKQDQLSTVVEANKKAINMPWSDFSSPSENRTKSKNALYFAPLALASGENHVRVCNKHSLVTSSFYIFSEAEVSFASKILNGHQLRFDYAPNYFRDLKKTQLATHLNSKKFSDADFLSFILSQASLAEELTEMRGWESATNNSKMNMFDRYHQAVHIWDLLIELSNSVPSWQHRFIFERARLMKWLYLEQRGEAEKRQWESDIKLLSELYPHPRLKMYLGERVANKFKDRPKISDNAPLWSQYQQDIMYELKRVAHWWALERQQENGEFGGKVGDDVELLRWWPILTLTGDKISIASWEKLAKLIWQHPKVENGFSKRVLDAEHASEYISDTTPSLAYFSDTDWQTQLNYTKTHFDLWTSPVDSGGRHFKSSWYSASNIDTRAPKNRDLDMNARSIKALRYLATLNNDRVAQQQMISWANAWLNVAMRTDKGKPIGIIPASVSANGKQINGDENTWYNANMFWDYFNWDRAKGLKTLSHLLSTYYLTKDMKYLLPLQHHLELVQKYSTSDNEALIVGTEQWVAKHLVSSSSFWRIVSEYRIISGDHRFDELIAANADPYTLFLLSADQQTLIDSLDSLRSNLQFNFPLRTSEVLFTDRVFLNHYSNRGVAAMYGMITGDTSNGKEAFVHTTWPNAQETQLTVNVRPLSDNLKYALEAELFRYSNSSSTHKKVALKLWRAPTNFRLHLSSDESTASQIFKDYKKGQAIELEIKPNTLYRLLITSIDP